jgi:hypothetical protein
MIDTNHNVYKVLILACKAAKDSITNDDGGSCNMDTVIVKIPAGLDFAAYAKAAGLLGFNEEKERSELGWHTLMPPIPAQGFNRTNQVEAMAKVLSEAGFSAYVNYVMD